jgi:hypothetical protein
MNHKGIRIAMMALFAIGLAGTVFAQGLYWESTISGGQLGERHEQMWAVPKKMKGVTMGTGETFIVRLDKELFITIDPREKTYTEMTFAEMEAMMKKASGKMDAKMAEMQKQLAGMPEEQRKMVEKMMGDKMKGMGVAKDAKINVKNTGDKKTISGFSCTKVVVTQDDKDVMTMWVTKDVSGFDAMRKDWEEFSKRMMAMNPMGGKGLGEAFQKVDGFPIRTEMGQMMTSTVTKIEKKTAPASEFEVPAGYKKVKANMMDEMNQTDAEEEKD